MKKLLLICAIAIACILFSTTFQAPQVFSASSQNNTLDEKYMLFGFDTNQNSITDGFIAGIPLDEAKTLLRRYPNMAYCNQPGSNEAKKATRTITILNSPQQAIQQMLAVKKSYDTAMKTPNASRICVHVKATRFDPEQPVNGVHIRISRADELITLQSIAVIPCQ